MMKRLIDVVAFGLLASVSFTACKDSAPAAPSAPEAVGVWLATVTGQLDGVDFTQTLTLTVNSDETYSYAVYVETIPVAAESGTWTVAAGIFLGTPSSCQEINLVTGYLETTTCGADASVLLPVSGISGNMWTVSVADGTLTFTRQ